MNTLVKTFLAASFALLALAATAHAQDATPAPKPTDNTVILPTRTGTVTFPGYYLWDYEDFDMVGLADARTVDEIVKKPLTKTAKPKH